MEQLIAQATKMENEAVKNSIRILEAARKEIAATVASTEWEMYRLPQLKSAVERAMQSYAQLYNMDLNDRQLDFWDQGILLVDEPVSAAVSANIAVAMPQIDTTMLGILQGYGTDLVTGLAADANKKITAELTRGLLGRKSPFEVMQAVGKNLKDKSIFKSIAARAETITRNECGRVLEAANQARREQAAKAVPGLKSNGCTAILRRFRECRIWLRTGRSGTWTSRSTWAEKS